ncbi:MAG: L-ribulose-5-phosphate 3-epimerase [Oscillospiraceae bacterium]
MKEYSLGLYEKAMPSGMPWGEMLDSANECGFDRVEISIDESDSRLARLDWTSLQRAELRNYICESGVPIETMCLSGHRRFPLGSHDSAVCERGLEIMQKAIELASDIGVRIIQLAGYDVYYEQGNSDTEKRFGENLAKSTEMAAKSGLILGFETMETPFMDTVKKSMHYVHMVESPFLGVYPDIGNLKNASLVYSSDLLEDIESGRGHIFAAHLKETVPGIYRDRNFGDGHTEYEPCIKKLWSMGVRMYTGEFWYLGEPDFKQTLKTSSAFLRSKIEASIK